MFPSLTELNMSRRSADGSENQTEAFIETGADIAGGATSTAIGFLIGDAGGAVASAAASPLLSRVFRSVAGDFVHRYLSAREKTRTSGVLALAVAEIDKRMRLGYELRHDDFFTGTPGKRSIAEEIAEGVLLAAQRENQEAKIPFLAHLLANTAFRHDIDRATANRLIDLAETLSYRQFCLLANVVQRVSDSPDGTSRFRVMMGQALDELDRVSPSVLTAVDEVKDLEKRGLVKYVNGGWTQFPTLLSPLRTGTLFHDALGLGSVDATDCKAIHELLSPPD